MNKKIVCLTALLIASSVQAQNGLYLSLEGGIAQQSGLPTAADVNAATLDNAYGLNAIRVGAGYNHDFNPVYGLGLEVGVAQYGNATYHYSDATTTKVTSDTLEFLVTNTAHIQQFDLVAKLGGLRLTPKVSGKSAPEEDTQIRLEAGIGGAYNLTPHLALTLNYAHVFGSKIDSLSDVGSKTPALNEALLGIRYTFHD